MHFYALTRGHPDRVKIWLDHLNTTYLPWKRKDLTTKEEYITPIQVVARPVQLFEIVFPAPMLPEFLAMQHKSDGTAGLNLDNEIRPEIKNYAMLLQKLMKLKPVPKFPDYKPLGYIPWEYDPVTKAPKGIPMNGKDWSTPLAVNFVPTDGVAIYGLGIKEDVEQDYEQWNVHQEGI